jgi:alkylation response protein AidB-like acyl-CoA dehydrogenase
MKFFLTHEQISIQDTVEQLVKGTLGDRGLHEVIDGVRDKEATLWREMGALGMLGVAVPEEYGGLELGVLELALISEALGYTGAPGPFLGHALATLAVQLGGDEQQRREWLPNLASGETIGTAAFAEEGGLWLPDQWTLAGGETISGVKTHVIGADQASLLVVGLAGGALAVVDAKGPGVTIEALDGIDRTRPVFRVTFDKAPAKLLSDGKSAASRVIDAGLALIAADAYGGGRRSVEMAVEYAKQREQFGQKIAQFQALRHQLANIVLEVEPCRGLYWYAAHAWDMNEDGLSHAAALAKSHITDRCLQAARDMVEAHGGIGFTWEYDAHIWLKRAMFNWAWLGAPPLHRTRVADLAAW